MLNKKICFKCLEQRHKGELRTTCNKLWEIGEAYCGGMDSNEVFISIHGNPPEKCPYILEHLISEA
jgi:hypothetical protein